MRFKGLRQPKNTHFLLKVNFSAGKVWFLRVFGNFFINIDRKIWRGFFFLLQVCLLFTFYLKDWE